MTVVFSRPYEFVPPDYGNIWPWIIQRLRLYESYLRKNDGVIDYECRGMENFRACLDNGDGILLAPNHCRYCDPVVLGWPIKILKTNVFAMASWHLFNEGKFNAFAIRKMGAFSLCREGTDRKSLEAAIKILTDAARPLVVFPEGTTSRTNDCLIPLLEGVTFIARAAARRRQAKSGGRVVILPIAIKYLCLEKVEPWARQQLDALESRLGWRKQTSRIADRIEAVFRAFLSLQELEHLGHHQSGTLNERRDALIDHLLKQPEARLGINVSDAATVGDRVRQIRTEVATRFFCNETSEEEKERLQNDAYFSDEAYQLYLNYPECYLKPEALTDTRVVEIIQRIQECFGEKFDVSMPLKAVIEFDQPMEVPPEKPPRGQEDPILDKLRERLNEMVQRLMGEARPLNHRA